MPFPQFDKIQRILQIESVNPESANQEGPSCICMDLVNLNMKQSAATAQKLQMHLQIFSGWNPRCTIL